MIRVTIQREENRHIMAYRVEGHAQYDQSGKDIVCAGVSAITVGTANALEALLKIRVNSSMHKGLLNVSILCAADKSESEKVQLLLEAMVVMLKTIEESYGNYILVKEENSC